MVVLGGGRTGACLSTLASWNEEAGERGELVLDGSDLSVESYHN